MVSVQTAVLRDVHDWKKTRIGATYFNFKRSAHPLGQKSLHPGADR